MSNIQNDKLDETKLEAEAEEARHITNGRSCWCRPEHRLVPETGDYIIIHNREN